MTHTCWSNSSSGRTKQLIQVLLITLLTSLLSSCLLSWSCVYIGVYSPVCFMVIFMQFIIMLRTQSPLYSCGFNNTACQDTASALSKTKPDTCRVSLLQRDPSTFLDQRCLGRGRCSRLGESCRRSFQRSSRETISEFSAVLAFMVIP
jgi:hypothetical protein